jgi:PAS domain S-box-containing protein
VSEEIINVVPQNNCQELEKRILQLEEEIVQLKNRGDAIKTSEERLRSLFNGSRDAVFFSDIRGNFADFNDAAKTLTGYSGEELLDITLLDLFPEDQQATLKKMTHQIKPGEVFAHEMKLLRKDDSLAHIELSSQCINVQNIPFILSSARDITKRKQMEITLLESEERYRTLFEKNPIETIIVDGNGRVSRYNLAKKRSGTRLPNIGDAMYKDYAGNHEIDMYDELMECIRTGDSKDFPELKYKDQFLRINISSFPGGAIITSVDITGYKRAEEALRVSEERFRTAFETSPDAIRVNRMADGVYIDINEGFMEMTGYSREDVIHRSNSEISIWENPDDREKFLDTLKKQNHVRNMESAFRLKDGTVRTGLMSARIMTWNNEPHILSVIRDIDDLKKAEAHLQKMEADRKQKERLQIILETAGAVCHELNQPLMAISGYSELILMMISEDNPVYDKNLKILEQITRMGEITGKLMGITKYRTKSFGRGGTIIDIEKASEN